MISVLPGILSVLGITIVAGVIAYIGDRVGHQVGRKRLTMFGLRPKYTSTIVAVATGMLIALSVTLVALVASSQVRTAFFHLGQLNAQINTLQAQAIAQAQELNTTRNANLVIVKGGLIGPGALIETSQAEDQQLRAFSAFFADTVRIANQNATRIGLQPDKKRSTDPQVRADLLSVLRDAREHWAAAGDGRYPLLFLPIASQNLFKGEPISISFGSWPDKRLYGDGDEIAAVDVEGGRPLSQADYAAIQSRAFQALSERGMPYPFFAFPSGFDPGKVETAAAQIARVKGRFRLVARSEGDLYPHSAQFSLAVTLEPRG